MLPVFQPHCVHSKEREQIFSFPFVSNEGKEKIATHRVQNQAHRAAPVRYLQDACQLRWQRLAASNKMRHNLHTPFICYSPTNSVEEPDLNDTQTNDLVEYILSL